MTSKQLGDKDRLAWACIDPQKIEPPVLRDLVNRIQQANSNAQGQLTKAASWSNWRDTTWKQRR